MGGPPWGDPGRRGAFARARETPARRLEFELLQQVLSVSNEVAAELATVDDGILGALRERMGCAIRLRGNQLTIEGDDGKVDEARLVIDELVELVEGGQAIGPGTVDAVLGALDAAKDPREIFEDVVWRHRGKKITPKTVNQKRYVDAIRSGTITFGIGPAGTGKTYLAMALAVASLADQEVNRLILTRPAVEAGERLGFLPGDMLAKVDPYLRPLYDALVRHARRRAAARVHGARHDRGRAARVHARPHAQRLVHHPRRGAEHDARADEDVPDAARASAPRSSSPATSRRSTCHRIRRRASSHVRTILGDIDGIEFVEFGEPGRRAPRARAAHRRGVQAPRRADGHAAPPVIRVEVANESGVAVDEAAAVELARRVIAAESVDDGDLGLAFVGPDRMRELKREHLGIDEATDVLSFPIDGRDELPDGVPRQLGDVVVCPQVVGEAWQAPLVHGLLHLLGYEHGTEMERRERTHLE